MAVRCLHTGALVRWNTRANAAPNHTRLTPTHEPRAYNVAADADVNDDADNDDDNNVVYHYDAPIDLKIHALSAAGISIRTRPFSGINGWITTAIPIRF